MTDSSGKRNSDKPASPGLTRGKVSLKDIIAKRARKQALEKKETEQKSVTEKEVKNKPTLKDIIAKRARREKVIQSSTAETTAVKGQEKKAPVKEASKIATEKVSTENKKIT